MSIIAARLTLVPCMCPYMLGDVRIRVIETHHLPRPSRFDILKRRCAVWIAQHVPFLGELEGVVRDNIDRESLLTAVEAADNIVCRKPLTLSELYQEYLDSLEVVALPRKLKTGLKPHNGDLCQLRVSSRVVSEVRVAVIARLGQMQDTQLNRDLVHKTARKIMKEAGFRDKVAVPHAPCVVDAYFNCTAYESKSTGSCRRCPKWLLKALGFKYTSQSSD